MKIKTNLFKKCFGKSKFLEVYGRMEVLDMATSTIVNAFVMSESAYDKLMEALMKEEAEEANEPVYVPSEASLKAYERGQELLKSFRAH